MNEHVFLHWCLVVLCAIALSGVLGSCQPSKYDLVLEPEVVENATPDKIKPLEDSLITPVLYKNITGLNKLEPQVKKEKFIAAVLPAILIAEHYIKSRRTKVMKLAEKRQWSFMDSTFYNRMATVYEADTITNLIMRMKPHPPSIVLAQAAVESGWGSSRFFQEANNLFGIWSYNPNEPRIPAIVSRDSGNTIYVRKYDDIPASIVDYYRTIGRARAYDGFRKARAHTDEVNVLLPYLRHYSERKRAYVSQLQRIIRQNNLEQYDHYQINPEYFVKPS